MKIRLAPVWNDFWWLWWPMISGDGWGLSFPENCLTVKVKPRKNLNQENWPDGDRTRARQLRGNDVTPRHSGDQRNIKLCPKLYRVLISYRNKLRGMNASKTRKRKGPINVCPELLCLLSQFLTGRVWSNVSMTPTGSSS